jgi:hypothetical protein
MHGSFLSPGLLSPTYESSNDAHVSSWHRYSSTNSITALCQLPGVGMGRTLQGKNKEALLS